MRKNPGFRRVMFVFLKIFATVAALSLCSTWAVAQTGCITGLVIDENGHPREHIKVEAQKMGMSWTHHETWTEANGRFQIRDLPPSEHAIVTGEAEGPYPNYANSFFYGTTELRVSVGASDACEDVVVHIGPATARLNLWVLDAVTKQPIKVPVVHLTRPKAGGLFRPSPGGEVTVPSMTELQMQLDAVGYLRSASMKLSPFQPGEVRDLSVELQPAQRACIAGYVTDEDGVPVAGARVRPQITNRGSFNEDHSVLTDAKGRFQVDDLEAGPYRVHAAKKSEGYLGTQNGVEVNLSSSWPCIEVALKIGLKAARVRFLVVDAKTGKEIASIRTGFSGQGDADYFSLVERLPEGKVSLVQPLRRLAVEIYAD